MCLFQFGTNMAPLRLGRQDKLSIRFGACSAGFGALLYLIYSVLRSYGDLSFLKTATAAPVGFLLRLLFQNATRHSDIIAVDAFQIQIIYECTGVFLVIVFCACVLAYPASWKAKAVGLAAGVPVIYATNILRVVLVTLVGRYSPFLFKYFHDYFWYGTFTLIIVFTWVFWLEMVAEREEQETLSC